jgi:hypothetical protein
MTIEWERHLTERLRYKPKGRYYPARMSWALNMDTFRTHQWRMLLYSSCDDIAFTICNDSGLDDRNPDI